MRKIIIPIMMFLFLLPSVFAMNLYETDYYTWGTANPLSLPGTSFKSSVANCSSIYSAKVNISGSSTSYSITTDYYSPISSKIGTSYIALTGNYSCFSQGQINGMSGSAIEGKAVMTRAGGYSHSGILQNHVTCGTIGDYINLTMGYGQYDSLDNSYNSYFYHTCITPYVNTYFVTESLMDSCSGVYYPYINPRNFTAQACPGAYPMVSWAMPFTTGDSGIIDYKLSIAHLALLSASYGYYELSDVGTFVSLVSTGTTGSLTLKTNTEYIFFIGGYTTSPGTVYNSPDLNISINIYSPAWSCSAWSECSGGLQHRTCEDPLGKIPDKVEYQGCLEEALATANLGFEEFVSMAGYPNKECIKTWYPFCLNGVVDIDWEIPVGWYVVNPFNRYFLDMTDETASEGSRSLKMWYIPPSVVPEWPALTVCNYTNEGSYPQIYQDVSNNTFFVEYDIVFPSPYMTMDFDVKGCSEPPVKYDGWCGKQCQGYQGNCTETPSGKYIFNLIDTVIPETLVNYYGETGLEWETLHIDITDIGIIPGRVYRLVFAISPENVYDGHANCVYFDNIRYSVRATELNCDNPQCVGINRYAPKLINDVCIFEVEYDSPECLSGTAKTKAENYQEYCIPGTTTLNTYNNVTKEWEKTENSTFCIQENKEAKIYEPNSLDQLWGFSLFIFAPVVIGLIIALVASAFLIRWTKISEGSGMVFLIMFLSILSVESLIGFFPFWITIVLILISGASIAFYMSKTTGA